MPAKATRFAWDNLIWATGVVAAASASATGFVPASATSAARWLYWRSSTTTGDQWIEFDLLTAQSLSCFLLAKWRGHSGGTIRIDSKVLSGDAYTSRGTFTLPSPDPTGVIAIFLASPVVHRFVRVYFTNTGAVSGYVEAGAVFAGPYFQPTRPIERGITPRLVDPSITRRALGGQRSTTVRPLFWRVDRCLLRAEPDADRVLATTMLSTVGTRRPLFFALDPDDPGYFIFYGRFEVVPGALNVFSTRWSFEFAFVEDVA
jgi:hypothetical protein